MFGKGAPESDSESSLAKSRDRHGFLTTGCRFERRRVVLWFPAWDLTQPGAYAYRFFALERMLAPAYLRLQAFARNSVEFEVLLGTLLPGKILGHTATLDFLPQPRLSI